jgi:hypothetical protein
MLFFHPVIFNEYLSPKYKTITQHILTGHDSQLYSKLICSISRQLKYLVDKQGCLIDRDNCSDMKVQNPVLFVIVFEGKNNKCEHYLKIKMLIFRFYDLGKKFLYNMNYGSPLLLMLKIPKFRVILI